MKVDVVRNILEANDAVAAELNARLTAKGILTLNLMSSPGSGKTTLLERTLTDLKHEFCMAVIEGIARPKTTRAAWPPRARRPSRSIPMEAVTLTAPWSARRVPS